MFNQNALDMPNPKTESGRNGDKNSFQTFSGEADREEAERFWNASFDRLKRHFDRDQKNSTAEEE